nr:DUF2514 domain-containing protein [Pseudomonas farsensis]
MLLVVASYWGAYEHGRSVERATAETAAATRDSGDRLAEVLGERDARQEEQRRAEAQNDARAEAHEQRIVADNAALDAAAAGQRLRDEATKLAATVGCPGPDPSVAARSQAASRAALVLSDLLQRADRRAGELAEAYDKARIAGVLCEAAYYSLRKSGPSENLNVDAKIPAKL